MEIKGPKSGLLILYLSPGPLILDRSLPRRLPISALFEAAAIESATKIRAHKPVIPPDGRSRFVAPTMTWLRRRGDALLVRFVFFRRDKVYLFRAEIAAWLDLHDVRAVERKRSGLDDK